MNDPTGAKAQVPPSGRGWLMLLSEVPSKPDYLRVKLRRRVQRLGAVGLKGAVYLLPNTPESLESFQWLRQEIVGDGGEASICAATMIDGMTDGDLVQLFNSDRDAEYSEFIATCADLEKRWAGVAADGDRAPLIAERARLFARLEEVLGRDFFSSPRKEDAMQRMERLAVLDIVTEGSPAPKRGEFRTHLWVTRAGVKVDRIASAWLIRREIDPAAKFSFVAPSSQAPDGAIRFDMFDGEFTHQGNRCTFEVLLDHFGITDPALRIIGQMVHDLDLHDAAFGRPETAGFASMINGIVATVSADEDRLREGAMLLDRIVAGLQKP